MKRFIQQREGFTLVESLVAISIFVIVFSVAIGGFVAALRTQRQIQSLISANSNASLIIEQMAREMRTGLGFQTSVSAYCPYPALPCELAFTTGRNESVVYLWDKINGSIVRRNGAGDLIPITAENVAVRYLGFKVLGECTSPTGMPSHGPRVTVVLGVSPKGERGVNDTVTEIQTTVASRQAFICSYPVPVN